MIVWRAAVAAQGVWAEIDEPLVKEGFDYIRHYTAAELTTILDCEKGRVICTSFQGTRKIEVVADPGQGEWGEGIGLSVEHDRSMDVTCISGSVAA